MIPAPEPADDRDFSGRFLLRVPKSLHRTLAARSRREGISLNTYCVSALSAATGDPRAAEGVPRSAPVSIIHPFAFDASTFRTRTATLGTATSTTVATPTMSQLAYEA
jgi:hypothetical protein